jgi:hypothetical protein
MGQLTFAGQMQALELGKWLRERYVNQLGLLPPSYQVWCSYQGWRGKGREEMVQCCEMFAWKCWWCQA